MPIPPFSANAIAIAASVTVSIADERKGTLKENPYIINENATYIGGPRIDLSSTNIRNIVLKKADPSELIAKKVMDYINTNELYK